MKAKPLGDGFMGVPVTEFRGAVLRPFLENRMSIGCQLPDRQRLHRTDHRSPRSPHRLTPFERIVGVPLKSYISLSWTYYFKQ